MHLQGACSLGAWDTPPAFMWGHPAGVTPAVTVEEEGGFSAWRPLLHHRWAFSLCSNLGRDFCGFLSAFRQSMEEMKPWKAPGIGMERLLLHL